ncbi:MAG: hypothetical protein CMJ34_02470 [Phycisphaerae bacterium]|nr:hypothetical protein [Phycisphaerae bacterium]
MAEYPKHVPKGVSDEHPVVFLHGWCGDVDEVEPLRAALPDRLLALPWMPAPGSFDLESWPEPDDRSPEAAQEVMKAHAATVLDQVRRAILDAGFTGATLVGHSMGGGMACVLAADPELAVERVVLLDSSTPMPSDRRDSQIAKMVEWVDRAATASRLVAQAAWIAEASSWVPDLFSLEDQGPVRMTIERRFLFAPVVEAAMTMGGAVQWPINESLESLGCDIHCLAGNPARMPVDAMRSLRPDARIEVLEDTGHYVHRFAAERTCEWLGGILAASPRA